MKRAAQKRSPQEWNLLDANKLAKISEGITLLERGEGWPGLRYKVRVWDSRKGKHKNKSFAILEKAIDHGRDLWASFEKQTDSAGRLTMDTVLPKWLAALKARNNSKGHIREIKRIMEAARAFGINNLKADDVAEKAERFIASYRPKWGITGRECERQPITNLRYATHFRALGHFCEEKRLMVGNPFIGLERPSVDSKLMPTLSLDECRLLLTPAALAHKGKAPKGKRGAPVAGKKIKHPNDPIYDGMEGIYWAFRLYMGMRRHEAAWTRWPQIHLAERRLHVTLEDAKDEATAARLGMVWVADDGEEQGSGKTVKRRKERLAILPVELIELLAPLRKEGDEYVFPDNIRSRDGSSECKSFRLHLARCGITRPDFKPKYLRATNACLWLAAGLDLVQLVEHLGHSSMETTRLYSRRASSYRVQCSDWKGEIRLKPKIAEMPVSTVQTRSEPQSNQKATAGSFEGYSKVDEPSPEEDIESQIFVILPDHSTLWEKAEQARDRLREAENRFENPCVPGSSPGEATTKGIGRNELDDGQDDAWCCS